MVGAAELDAARAVPCEVCGGSGKVREHAHSRAMVPCTACLGSGIETFPAILDLEVVDDQLTMDLEGGAK